MHEWFYIDTTRRRGVVEGWFWRLGNILYVKLRVEDRWV